jgi:hypothetical protein
MDYTYDICSEQDRKQVLARFLRPCYHRFPKRLPDLTCIKVLRSRLHMVAVLR